MLKSKASDIHPTGYLFGRRLASFLGSLGWLVSVASTVAFAFSVAKSIPGGGQAIIPAVGGLCLVLLAHVAIAVFNISDQLLGQEFGSRRNGDSP